MPSNISFKKFDSTQFPTIVESIQHADTNPLLIENLSDWMLVEFEGEEFMVQEPMCTFKSMIYLFDEVLTTIDIPESEYYLPERTAMRIYDNADLWFVILLTNNIFSRLDYNRPKLKSIPASQLSRIEKFTSIHKGRVRKVRDVDLTNHFK